MLTLTRRAGERIRIGPDIEVSVVSISGGRVRLGVHAPRDVAVVRAEVVERVGSENASSVAQNVETAAGGFEITFPGGLPGLGGNTTFVLCDLAGDSSVRALVSCTDPTVQLLVADAEEIWPGYPSDDARACSGLEGETAVALVLRMPADGGPTTANLMAPLVIAIEPRVGRQVVLEGHAFSTAEVVGGSP